ncbi:MAG: ribonuclease III [Christensenellales bacterium]
MQNISQIIQYEFNDKKLLMDAITHSSVNGAYDFDRLEYLGDAVLELCISRYLFDTYQNAEEGQLTKLRAGIVSEPSLAKAARDLNLHSYIFLGKGEENSGGREKASILSDALEAVIGAVYLDGGIESAQKFVLYALRDRIQKAAEGESKDSKTELQELLQSFSQDPITYRTTPCVSGGFYSEVIFQNKALGGGCGTRKKTAEQSAAKEALKAARNLV